MAEENKGETTTLSSVIRSGKKTVYFIAFFLFFWYPARRHRHRSKSRVYIFRPALAACRAAVFPPRLTPRAHIVRKTIYRWEKRPDHPHFCSLTTPSSSSTERLYISPLVVACFSLPSFSSTWSRWFTCYAAGKVPHYFPWSPLRARCVRVSVTRHFVIHIAIRCDTWVLLLW